MASKSVDELKSYFKTGAKPTEEQFVNLIDSLIDISAQNFLLKATPGDAESGQNNDLYMTPFTTLHAINALSSLMNAPTLKAEVKNEIQTAINTLQSTLIAITDQLRTDVSTKENQFSKNTAFNKNFGTGNNEVARGNHTHQGYEPAFSKNTAFNKSFGTGNNEVARGDHTHDSLILHSGTVQVGDVFEFDKQITVYIPYTSHSYLVTGSIRGNTQALWHYYNEYSWGVSSLTSSSFRLNVGIVHLSAKEDVQPDDIYFDYVLIKK